MSARFPAVVSSLSVADVTKMIVDSDTEMDRALDINDYHAVNQKFILAVCEVVIGRTGSEFLTMMQASFTMNHDLQSNRHYNIRSKGFQRSEMAIQKVLLNMKTASNLDFIRLNFRAVSAFISVTYGLTQSEETEISFTLITLSSLWLAYDQMCVNNEFKEEIYSATEVVLRSMLDDNTITAVNPLVESVSNAIP